jgi:5-(carboxyamino)imidazole ribonucleotide mutase
VVEPLVGVVMGSSSDHEIMADAEVILDRFAIGYEVHVISAHRTPEDAFAYGRDARGRGLRVLIAAAGGAAHLAGVLAAVTTLPVIGVPIALARLDGMDSLLSMVQMPRGVPVATVAINGATNAALLAARILATSDEALADALDVYRQELAAQARAQDRTLPRN